LRYQSFAHSRIFDLTLIVEVEIVGWARCQYANRCLLWETHLEGIGEGLFVRDEKSSELDGLIWERGRRRGGNSSEGVRDAEFLLLCTPGLNSSSDKSVLLVVSLIGKMKFCALI
jgi:hypothetical protein